MRSCRNTYFKVQSHSSSRVVFHRVRAIVHWHKIDEILACPFAEQTSIILGLPFELYLFMYIYLFVCFQFPTSN